MNIDNIVKEVNNYYDKKFEERDKILWALEKILRIIELAAPEESVPEKPVEQVLANKHESTKRGCKKVNSFDMKQALDTVIDVIVGEFKSTDIQVKLWKMYQKEVSKSYLSKYMDRLCLIGRVKKLKQGGIGRGVYSIYIKEK